MSSIKLFANFLAIIDLLNLEIIADKYRLLAILSIISEDSWSNNSIFLFNSSCSSVSSLFIELELYVSRLNKVLDIDLENDIKS